MSLPNDLTNKWVTIRPSCISEEKANAHPKPLLVLRQLKRGTWLVRNRQNEEFDIPKRSMYGTIPMPLDIQEHLCNQLNICSCECHTSPCIHIDECCDLLSEQYFDPDTGEIQLEKWAAAKQQKGNQDGEHHR